MLLLKLKRLYSWVKTYSLFILYCTPILRSQIKKQQQQQPLSIRNERILNRFLSPGRYCQRDEYHLHMLQFYNTLNLIVCSVCATYLYILFLCSFCLFPGLFASHRVSHVRAMETHLRAPSHSRSLCLFWFGLSHT